MVRPNKLSTPSFAFVANLAVDSVARRRGIGSLMIRYCGSVAQHWVCFVASDIQQCSTVQDMPTYGKVQCFEMLQGMDEIMLTVEEENQDARKMYGSLGIQEY